MANAITSSEFTPGPWHIDRNSPYAKLCIKPLPGPIVCDICPMGNAQDEANAHLIAAAPKLLERCKMSLHDANDVLSGKWVPTAEGWQSIIEDLSSVIAEAEGK